MKLSAFLKTGLFWWYWFPVLIYCAAIFLQSSFPSPDRLSSVPLGDKAMHFLAYAILGGLFFRAFVRTRVDMRTGRAFLLSVLLTTLYGISDEIHQSFVPHREADIMDVMANTIGSVAGVFTYHQLVTRGRPRLVKFLN
jgi:VanZ family protein